MKIKKLSDLAQITSGYNINRVKSESKTEFEYKMITTNSMKEGLFRSEDLKKVFLIKKASSDHLTKEGDIVVKILSPIEALYVTKDMEGLLVPINFYIIRVDNEAFINRYISFYLNQISSHLDAMSVGSTNMKKISAKGLGDIEIKVIPLNQQEQICKTLALLQKELELFQLKQEFYKSALKTLMEGKR